MASRNSKGSRPMQHLINDNNQSSDLSAASDLEHQQSEQKARDHNDAVTIAYIQRVLRARPRDPESIVTPGDLLPPLTSSNAIDTQLYALIAVILSNFVQTWYNRITPDQQFVREILQIIAHCTTGLEQRLRKIDLERLVLDELPELVTDHVNAVRTAQFSRIGRLAIDEQRSRYHSLRPNMALSPVPVDTQAIRDQQENETAWCLVLVNRILPLILPPQDLQNPCLDVLVTEIFSQLIFCGGVCNKASEPWLIWDGVAKLLHSMRAAGSKADPIDSLPVSRLDEYGLLSPARAPKDDVLNDGPSRGRLETFSQSFWFVIQCVSTLWLFVRAIAVALMQASSLPRRSGPRTVRTGVNTTDSTPYDSSAKLIRGDGPIGAPGPRPIVSMHIWGCISQLLSLNLRMPWLSGILSLAQWISLHGPGRCCDTNSRLDRLISSHVHATLLSPHWLSGLLQAARSAIFPNNALAPARIPPTLDEVNQIRRECAEAIVDTIPAVIRTRFFATTDEQLMREDVEADLGIVGDQYINKHLIISVVELIAVRLFPELAD